MPALSRRPAGLLGGLADLFTWFVRARDWYFALPRFKFEAMTLGLAVLAGLIVMPVLIYLAGRIALKEYIHGSVFALYWDFFKGLFQLRTSYWLVLAGPFVFLTLFRVFRWILRKL
jgi:hypothetical protein